MRQTSIISDGWLMSSDNFKKPPKKADESFVPVVLPHTFENSGMTVCWYYKELHIEKVKGRWNVLSFSGAAGDTDVYVNGHHVDSHQGEFGVFFVDITNYIKHKKAAIAVCVKKPQGANRGFILPCGLYGEIALMSVDELHFDYEIHGGTGIIIRCSVLSDGSADVRITAHLYGMTNGYNVVFDIDSKQQVVKASATVNASYHIGMPELWDGVGKAKVYTLKAAITSGDRIVDNVQTTFGIRSYNIDSSKGFCLNGKAYPIHGVTVYPDRAGLGLCATDEQMEEDIRLICDMGANAIRCPGYFHRSEFYSLCDKYGLIVLAEIPIPYGEHNKDAKKAAENSTREMIYQNINHPSIFFWGVGELFRDDSADFVDTVESVNALCHTIDSARQTIMTCDEHEKKEPYIELVGYRRKGPECYNDISLLCSGILTNLKGAALTSLGAPGNHRIHNDMPVIGDLSEESQMLMYQRVLDDLALRTYIWGVFIDSMFDYASKEYEEYEPSGMCLNGLVEYDRVTLKDSYYLFMAYWSKEPFVHICAKVFSHRVQDTIVMRICSNMKKVGLSLDGETFKELTGDKLFTFTDVPLEYGDNPITAYAPDCVDDYVVIVRSTPQRDDMGLPIKNDTVF